jgi:hypothetical protein
VRLSAAHRAWERWLAAAGAWKGWTVCPALVASPRVDTPRMVTDPPDASACAAALGARLTGGGVLVVLDLDPVLGARVAARLNAAGLANAVLVLPRWPYEQAVLPTEDLVRVLIAEARRLSDQPALPNVVLVLDAERSRSIAARPQRDRRADNRYRLAPPDLPDLAALRARGIRQILKVSALSAPRR